MPEIGYALSSEEHPPNDLVRLAKMAEDSGFTFALISDHYHPWIDQQGNAPFAWSVLGGISQATERLRVGTGVTCPTMRYHPAIIAQAVATVGSMMPGRFFLGVGTGENLNEHIVGLRWPAYEVRQEMLEEAVDIIRKLWEGNYTSYYGMYYVVENARIYNLPDPLPPVYVAASGPESAKMAGQIGDGLIDTAPKEGIVEQFKANGGTGPAIGQLTVCWAEDEAEARRIAYKWWPTAALPGALGEELSIPKQYESAVELVTEDDVAKTLTIGPDPQRHIDAIRKYEKAGFDQIYIHQIGPNQERFFRFYQQEVLPKFQ